METSTVLQSVDYARLAVDIASEKQGADILMLNIQAVSDFTDYFVIVTGESRRQLSSLVEDIKKALGKQRATLHHIEGTAQGGWILMDFGDLVVHLFGPQEREHYRLEDMWNKGIETVRIQ